MRTRSARLRPLGAHAQSQALDAASCKFLVQIPSRARRACSAGGGGGWGWGGAEISSFLKLLAPLLEQILARLADCFSYASLAGRKLSRRARELASSRASEALAHAVGRAPPAFPVTYTRSVGGDYKKELVCFARARSTWSDRVKMRLQAQLLRLRLLLQRLIKACPAIHPSIHPLYLLLLKSRFYQLWKNSEFPHWSHTRLGTDTDVGKNMQTSC